MSFADNMRARYAAMKIGMSILGEGMGFKSSRTGVVSNLAQALQSRWGEPPKRSSEEWLKLYGKSPRLNPIYKIAHDVAAAKWGLYAKRGKEKESIDVHPMIDLLTNPNPNPEMTGYIMMYMTEAYLLLRGEAFWLIERNGLGVPSELWIVPPTWIMHTPDVVRPYFIVQPYNTESVLLYISPEDMVFFKEPDLANPYGRGTGRAEGIGDEVETDEYMSKWAKRFFFNDAKPPLVIQAPGADKDVADRLKEEWMAKYSGYNNAHKPAVLPWEAKVQELGKAQKEMDFVESRKFLRDTSNQHFMVPPEMMGVVEGSNRATIDAADYIYKDNVLSARLKLIEGVIQNQICRQYDPKLLFEYENIVPEDKDFALERANDGFQRGAITVDEWRKANGWDPLGGKKGEIFYVPNNVIARDTPYSEEPPGNPEDTPPPPPPEDSKKRIKRKGQTDNSNGSGSETQDIEKEFMALYLALMTKIRRRGTELSSIDDLKRVLMPTASDTVALSDSIQGLYEDTWLTSYNRRRVERGESPLSSVPKDVAKSLAKEAKSVAKDIMGTYTKELESQFGNLATQYQDLPVADQMDAIETDISNWAKSRASDKSEEISITESGKAWNKGLFAHDEEFAPDTMYGVAPESTEHEACQEIIDGAPYTLEQAKATPLPLHPRCPHRYYAIVD